MKTSSIAIVLIVVAVLVGANLFLEGTFDNLGGDGRNLRWDRFDVFIDNIRTSQNTFDVTESYQITITTGPFSFGTAEIPLGRTTGIDIISVTVDGTVLTRSTGCYGLQGSYCETTDEDTIAIKYYFPRTAFDGDRRNIQIKYTVSGALRSYKEGDQLYWVAVPKDRPFPVEASQVSVVMPRDLEIQKTASYPDDWKESQRDNTLTWTSPGRIDIGEQMEARVQYPHDPRMEKPDWQAGYDREQSYIDNIQPIVSLLTVVLALLVGIGGALWVVMRYLTKGRDPEAIVVPEYLTEPPSDELPGIIGTLLDERADMQDLMATLVDLAQKGYLVIEQTETGGLMGMFQSVDFRFHRGDLPVNLLAIHEQRLMHGLFPMNAAQNTLSGLKEKFYTHISGIKKGLYEEAVRRDYFPRSPETTRMSWMVGGIALMAIGFVLYQMAKTDVMQLISPLFFLPALAVGLVGAAAVLVSNEMPVKTQKGAQEAARWRAFRRYLSNIDQYSDIEIAAKNFDKYIPYAVAFGLENEVTQKLIPAMKSMPTWYFPTYLGGPWHGGYVRGRTYHQPSSHQQQPVGGPGGFGGIDFDGPGGLNSMNRALTDGLNAMNTGMTRLLNDASHAMTSRPKSSGSGGRGGWSGGGSRGGGGSGGGSRGFG